MNVSGKFISPHDPETFVFATWEGNWKNTKIYAGGKLIFRSDDASVLSSGVTVDSGQGMVNIKLVGKELEISVDQVPYIKEISGDRFDFSGLILIFWILSGFSAFVNVFQAILWSPYIGNYPEYTIAFAIDVACTLIYIATAFLIGKKVYWMYFVGASLFTLTSVISLLNFDIILSSLILIITALVRLGFLFFILRGSIDIIKSMRQSKPENSTHVLDQEV